jgi:transposase
MKLAGPDLFEISAGKRKGQRRISKRGRSLLRKILYCAAIQTIINGNNAPIKMCNHSISI